MLEIKNKKFYMDSKPFDIYSGAMHYFRTVPEYWEDRLTKLKAAGFNTVETYVCWNLHEKKPGEFDFSGILDIEKYLEIAQKVGLYAIVRPGPYICAEWDFGGLPAWLLKDKNMQIRCMYPDYLKCVERFYKELLPRLVPHLESHGGNIIAMQVENEYGSYGNDKDYLRYVEKLTRDCGIDCLLFTSDENTNNMISGGSLPDIYKVLNFGSRSRTAFNVLKGFENDGPNMCGEFWCGWFDHWRDKHHTRNSLEIVNEIKGFIDNGASFNIYMFHGGTNFGFTAGANHNQGHGYEPTVTSYDYCAMLTEWGDYTPAYHAVRKLLCEKQGIEPPELPESPKLQSIGKVELTETASLFENLDNIGEKHHVSVPEGMEYFGQNFGLIYYETTLKGKYNASPMYVKNVHDFAEVYFDGEKKTSIDRTLYSVEGKTTLKDVIFKKKKGESSPFLMPALSGERKIGVLVDTMGRVNYGGNMLDRKGISDIYLGIQRLMNYDVWTLPLDNLDKLKYSSSVKKEEPVFLKGSFKTDSKADCFIHLDGFNRGCVYINGFNLGRFWKVGPQKSLYIPGTLLKDENEIIVFNIGGYSKPTVSITDKHNLG
ncbi:MAG: beta-galactosidase [Ruminococcus sp.]|nr:beta-galactosidase [Ruminococcus sp.]MDY6059889.1 beta-galactosidase family protein [Candidatus Fimenecus sp.]